MTLNAKHVAQWWSYRTRHQLPAKSVVTLWLESGPCQELNSMHQGSTQQEDNNGHDMDRASQL